MVNTFKTAEHIQLINLLTKMVKIGKLDEIEKESILTRSGLIKISDREYADAENSSIIINY